MRHIYHLLILLSTPVFSFGQIQLGGSDPQELVLNALSGTGVSISNVQYTGAPEAISYFQANSVNSMPFTAGFVMTTGHKNYVVGPNNTPNAGTDNTFPGFSAIEGITGNPTYNACIIAFDLIPYGDTLRIRFVFGSEEHPEFVGRGFNDAFAIFVSGPGIAGTVNIAKLPNYSNITVNNINAGVPGYYPATNPEYFIDNGTGDNAPYNSSPNYLQYDGLTKPISAKLKVVPNQTYQVKLVIADAQDPVFDSGVFIEEGGITASLGENDLNESVKIFFNSENQQARIELTEYPDQLTYSITDLSGKVLVQSKIAETTTLDMSNYSSGMYLIRVGGANGQISKKIMR
ncbi:hypothetical protein D3C87_37320 [compost metagenome]